MIGKKYIIFAVIIFTAFFLRFYQLGQNPPSLTWDETAWGYNAYSLGIDGKDEFGRFLPVDYLESFGDFKPPVYAYLDVLPVKLFGLNEFAVRFPSALFGVLTVLLTYFLVKRIFVSHTNNVALLSAFLLAISPWHINLSRAAFEANVATLFLVAGVWLFLESVQGKKWYLTFSAVSFALSMYTFNTARIVAPLLVLLLTVGFYKQLRERKIQVFLSILVGVIVVLPLARFMLTPAAKLRFQEVNIFSDIGVIQRTNQEIANDKNAWWSKILHNRRLAYSIEYLRHYFDNLNPSFLFIKGDGNPKFSTQNVGQLYSWEFPFLVAGLLFLIKRKEGRWWLIPLWLLIGILPAATARETPHALRIETTLPTFQILTAYGLVYSINKISNIKNQIAKIQIKYLIFTLCLLFFIFNFLYYYHGYYAHYPREYSGEWQYGYKEAISYVKTVQEKYDTVIFTESLGRPYAYMLFYTKEDPSGFRQTAKVTREALGFVHVEEYGKYVFAKDPKNVKLAEKKVLYIDTVGNVSSDVKILKTFYLLNNQPILVAYEK